MRRFDDDVPPGLETQLIAESAFDDLTSPRSSGVDIENALETIKVLRRSETRLIRRFLGLATQKISDWVITVGEIEPVLEAVLPHLNTVRQAAEKDPVQQGEFKRLSTSILAEFLAPSPASYPEYFKDLIKRGEFGTPTETLTNLLIKICSKEYQSRDEFHNRTVEYGFLVLLMLGDLATYRNPQLLEQIAPHIPGYLLFTKPGLVEHSHPLQRVEEILKVKGAIVPKMAEMVAQEPDSFDEDLERKVLAGKFGEPREVLGYLLRYMSSSENLPKNRSDEYEQDYKLLMPILLSGLFQDMDPLKLSPEQLKSFIWQYEEPIFINLRLQAPEYNIKGLDRLKETGEFAERLVGVFQIIREYSSMLQQLNLYPAAPDDFLVYALIHYQNFEEFFRIKDEVSGFFELFEDGKPLHGRTREIVQDILKSPSPLQRALEIHSIFTKNVPFWKQVFLYIETILSNEVAFSKSEYPIRKSANFVTPPVEQYDFTRHHEMEEEDISSLPIWAKRGLTLDDFHDLSDEEVEKITYIPFRQLNLEAKRLTILNYLRKTMGLSQSLDAKQQADERNRNLTKDSLILSEGTYLHGSDVRNIDSILYHGNLSGECLGVKAKADTYPFHVDVYSITSQEVQRASSNFRGVIEHTQASTYGNIIYTYDRNKNSWEAGVSARESREAHNLVFIGIPSTEITAILIKDPSRNFEEVKQAVLENGFYIPVYDLDGKLLFTPDDFDSVTEERNLKVPVEVWSTSLQVGDRRGSNEGGEFVIPSERGARRFYVKYYPKEAGSDHLWTEQLADNIYRFIGTPVPETKIVRVDDKFGHASEILEPDPNKDSTTLKGGFLIDALLANWDIVYNSSNTITVGGIIYRIDNGGALHYRAAGIRKDEESFGVTVKELEFGSNRRRLGLGMRQEYPGLTEQDITRQLELLETKLTPDTIESLVDGVRLSALDRAFLKSVISQRRSYVLSYFQNTR